MTAYNCWNSKDLASVRHTLSRSCSRTFSGLSREVSVQCGSFSSPMLQVIHTFHTVSLYSKETFMHKFLSCCDSSVGIALGSIPGRGK
jgi:hypothetical protein